VVVISKIMLHTGNHAAETTANDVVDYHRAAWRLRGKVDGAWDAWDLLTGFGGFPRRHALVPRLRAPGTDDRR
jgi:hypothetical protein